MKSQGRGIPEQPERAEDRQASGDGEAEMMAGEAVGEEIAREEIDGAQEERERWEEEIARRYAPMVYLSKDEQWFPCSVEWFVQRSELCFDPSFNTGRDTTYHAGNPVLFKAGELVVREGPRLSVSQDLKRASASDLKGVLHRSGASKESDWRDDLCPGFYLRLVDPLISQLGQSPQEIKADQVPVYCRILYGTLSDVHPRASGCRSFDLHRAKGPYVQVAEKPEELPPAVEGTSHYVDLQYYFCYAYNGILLPSVPNAGIHESDWEHVTVRISLDQPDTILGVFTAAHGKEGRWHRAYAEDNLEGICFVPGTQNPVVFSARGGHASYIRPGRQLRHRPCGLHIWILDDDTDEEGVKWCTWNNVEIMRPHVQPWLKYRGLWGNRPQKFLASGGQWGPGQKKYFWLGDPAPVRGFIAPPAASSEPPFFFRHLSRRSPRNRALLLIFLTLVCLVSLKLLVSYL